MLYLLLRFGVLFGVGSLVYLALQKYHPDHLVVGILLYAVAVSRFFAAEVIEFIPAMRRSVDRSILEPWQGRYYMYDNHQVRFSLVDGAPWIVADDARAIVTPPITAREQRLLGPHYAALPGHRLNGYSEQGLLRLLELRLRNRGGRRDMLKFRNWLEHDALPNLKRLPASAAP